MDVASPFSIIHFSAPCDDFPDKCIIKFTIEIKNNMKYYKKTIISSIATKLGINVRDKMVNFFMSLMDDMSCALIVDLGVTSELDSSANYLEQVYPYPSNITCLGIEDFPDIIEKYPGVSFLKVIPGQKLPFKDGHFNYLYSNAVIEHVGTRADQKKFVDECLRVSNYFFITTPYKWFPVEMHTQIPFLHYLPPRVFRYLLKKLGEDFYSEESNLNLLDKAAFLSLFPQNISVQIKFFYAAGFPSNMVAFGSSNDFLGK